jgi:hypothetical protein
MCVGTSLSQAGESTSVIFAIPARRTMPNGLGSPGFVVRGRAVDCRVRGHLSGNLYELWNRLSSGTYRREGVWRVLMTG